MKTRSKTGNLKIPHKFHYPSDGSPECGSGIFSPDSDFSDLKSNQKRFRKNEDQVKVLIQEFDKNPFWTKKLVQELSLKTGLSESQVYKWNWDYRKKIRKFDKQPDENKFWCKETLSPGIFEDEMQRLKKGYKSNLGAIPMTTPSRFLYSGM